MSKRNLFFLNPRSRCIRCGQSSLGAVHTREGALCADHFLDEYAPEAENPGELWETELMLKHLPS